jgi:hypothetical protein
LRKSFPRPELADVVGSDAIREHPVVGAGYGTNTAKWTAELADGRHVFVKHALDERAAEWLRREHNVYAAVNAPFVPAFYGWHDTAARTFLVIEDLSDAHWPPPWHPAHMDAMLAALDAVHASAPPPGLARVEDDHDFNGWLRIGDDPGPFLSLRLCSRAWLDRSLPALLDAAGGAALDGDAFLHLDARGDNACMREGQAILVDWNWAAIGNGLVDVVGWLPSLRLEGGPEPWTVVDDSRGLAALFAGFFLALAPLPPPATAPRVREFQRLQGEVALGWAARELDLDPPTLNV